MYLIIVNKDTNLTEEMTEDQAVERFGAERLNLILIGQDPVFEGDDITEEMEGEMFPEDMDGDHESALASAGWGTDEDYGFYGEM